MTDLKRDHLQLGNNISADNLFVTDQTQSDVVQLLSYVEKKGWKIIDSPHAHGADSLVFVDTQGNVIKMYKSHLTLHDVKKYYELQKHVQENKNKRGRIHNENRRNETTYDISVEDIEIIFPNSEGIVEVTIGSNTYVQVTLPYIQGDCVKLTEEERRSIVDIYTKAFPDIGSNMLFETKKSHKKMKFISYPNIRKYKGKYYVTDVNKVSVFLSYFD